MDGVTYLPAEAVADSADLLHSQCLTHILDGRLDQGLNLCRLVLRDPGHDIYFARIHIVDADLVALKKVRDDSQVTIAGELVGEELGIGEDAEDVRQKDDGLLGVIVVLGVGDISVDWIRGGG